MKDPFSYAIGFVIAVCLFCVLVQGFSWGKDSVVTDCKAFGAFRNDNVVYTCAVRP